MTFKRLRENESDNNRTRKVNAVIDALNSSTSETLAEHEAATDPHPQYLTPAEGNAAYDALGAAAAAVSAHEEALDPHPQYAKKVDYGQRSISLNSTAIAKTAAVDGTLATNTDYTQVTGIWDAVPSGVNSGVTQQTNSLTVARAGFYRIEFWASVRAGSNNTQVGFKFAVNGVIGLIRRPKIFMRNTSEVHSGAAFGYTHFNAGDVVTLWIASTTTTDITIEDAVFGVHSMKID